MEIWHTLTGIAVGLCLGLVVLSMLRLPPTPLARPLFGFLICAGLWVSGDFVAAQATDLTWKRIGLALLYSGAIYFPSFWWLGALRWAEACDAGLPLRGRWWGRAPLLFASLMWIAMISNPWHGHFITPVVGGRNVYGPLWWCMAVPNYALIVGGLIVELEVVRRVRRPGIRRQALFPIAASLVTLSANLIWVAGLASFNATAIVLSASTGLLLIGMVRDGLFGVLPVALPVVAAHDPDGIVIVRLDGRVAYLNPRARELLKPIGLETHLCPVFDAAGVHLESGETPGASATQGGGWWQLLETAEGATYRSNGAGTRWLHVSARAVPGRWGRLRAFCLRVRDVTDEKRREVQLRRADRLESVTEITGHVAEGFHNALGVILANAQLLLVQHPDDQRFQRRIGRITEVAEKALSLAQQLQVAAGEVNALRSDLELSDFLQEICDFLEPALGDDVHLRLNLTAEPLQIDADAMQLQQVICNMIVNAREAVSEDDGEISLATGTCWLDPARIDDLVVGRAEPAGDYAYVWIADNGRGMEPRLQERIFEPFFTTKGKDRGTGLSPVIAVMRAHDALLQLETQPGLGSVFTLYFPLERRAATSEGRIVAAAEG